MVWSLWGDSYSIYMLSEFRSTRFPPWMPRGGVLLLVKEVRSLGHKNSPRKYSVGFGLQSKCVAKRS